MIGSEYSIGYENEVKEKGGKSEFININGASELPIYAKKPANEVLDVDENDDGKMIN